jgi:hypothetical protein
VLVRPGIVQPAEAAGTPQLSYFFGAPGFAGAGTAGEGAGVAGGAVCDDDAGGFVGAEDFAGADWPAGSFTPLMAERGPF